MWFQFDEKPCRVRADGRGLRRLTFAGFAFGGPHVRASLRGAKRRGNLYSPTRGDALRGPHFFGVRQRNRGKKAKLGKPRRCTGEWLKMAQAPFLEDSPGVSSPHKTGVSWGPQYWVSLTIFPQSDHRRHKLRIVRPAASGRSHSLRCASSPHENYVFAGPPFVRALWNPERGCNDETVCKQIERGNSTERPSV